MVRKQMVDEEINFDSQKIVGQKKKIITAVVIILAVLGLGWYVFDVLRNKPNETTGGTGSVQNIGMAEKKGTLNLSNTDPEVGGVVEKVSKHILLPPGEIQVATVNDAAALMKQYEQIPQFQYVKNGDKLLISPSGIIVYDPTLDKVVDVIH